MWRVMVCILSARLVLCIFRCKVHSGWTCVAHTWIRCLQLPHERWLACVGIPWNRSTTPGSERSSIFAFFPLCIPHGCLHDALALMDVGRALLGCWCASQVPKAQNGVHGVICRDTIVGWPRKASSTTFMPTCMGCGSQEILRLDMSCT